MASDSKLLLTTQPEKPNHYSYLKEFRVEQCTSFLQHKCNQHRPFVCFNWHFMNQRRRRPVRKRDGTFNYSADNYCVKYDETTGICPDGDDCPFLHRTAGDTERRYHLRYYKTCMCVHDTDSRGYCVKNGHHCAFAHGAHDQRPPVYDIKEIEAAQNAEANSETANGPNALDKERSLMNEDPKWQDTNYVLANYKTEPCKRPPRLCRQGYACPQYHNSKDKRRSPRKFKYRSTPCPNVKHSEEWGEPANCEAGDNCQYCHTRTEQQFHPEIYKSTKCNDVQQAGYCPRSVFCAFAHVEPYAITEDVQHRDLDGPSTTIPLSEMISSVLPPEKKDKLHDLNNVLQNGSSESCESASTSSIGSNNSHNNTSKAPGAQLQHKNSLYPNSLSNGGKATSIVSNSTIPSFHDFTPELRKQLLAIENDPLICPQEKEQRKRMCLTFNVQGLGSLDKFSNLDDLSSLMQSSTTPLNIPGSQLSNSISGILQGTSAPVNIPGSSMNNFSPNNHTNMFNVSDPFSHLSDPTPKINNSFGHNDSSLFFQSHLISPNIGETLSMSPDLSRLSEINPIRDELSTGSIGNTLFENSLHNKQYSMSPSLLNSSNLSDIHRLREDFVNQTTKHLSTTWEDQILQATKACEVWKSEADESNRKATEAKQQRDEALNHVQLLTNKLEQVNGSIAIPKDLRGLSIQKLKALQTKLRSDLEEVEKVLYLETATKCMKCEENARSVTLPCNHFVLCDICAKTVRECPYCQTLITS